VLTYKFKYNKIQLNKTKGGFNMNDYGYWPKDWDDFVEYVKKLEDQQHDYNSICYALRDATLAFFNYFSSKHGMTGFQASWSALDFLGKVYGFKAPYKIIDSSKMLYPQYDLHKELDEFIERSLPELAKIAKERIEKTNDGEYVDPDVWKRWTELAAYYDEK
jgi:hypothetical protein